MTEWRYARGGGGSRIVGAFKNVAGGASGADDSPSGEATRAWASMTADGPSIETSVARPLSDVLRQVQVGVGAGADLWCIGHSVASL
jgi:hypothetical protein